MPRPRNNVLRSYFETNELSEIICKNGSCSGKILSKHAGNLERHLKIVHSEIYKNYIQHKSSASSNGLSECVKISKEINKHSMEMAIVELFTKNGRPLCMTEDRAFKKLMQPVFETLKINLNEHNVIERIIIFSQKTKSNIIEELKGRLLSLKIDAATRQHLSVLGINVQYIKNKCITVKKLAIKELKQRHTSDYLKSVMLEVLSDYKIDLSQILTITTDNGSNMVKAVNNLNFDLRNSLEEDDLINNSTEDSLQSIENNFSSDVLTNIRCGTHTLQLCVNDVLKKVEINQKIEKCRSVVKKLRSQTYLALLKNGGYKRPLLDCVTRWNSTYIMVERLFELKDIITSLSSDNANFLISSDEWNFFAEFLNTFSVVCTATVKLQSEKLLYSDLYIIILDIILQLENLPSSEIQASLIEALNKRKSKLFDNDLFKVAVFLDPRIKVTLQPEQIARAKICIGLLHMRITLIKEKNLTKDSQILRPNTNEPSTSSQAYKKPKTVHEFLQNLDPTPMHVEPISSLESRIETDLHLYERQHRISLDSNVMEFWSGQNNTLAAIAEIVLAIPCTQVSVERLFLALKYILSDQRNKLTPINLEHILLVRTNGDFNYE